MSNSDFPDGVDLFHKCNDNAKLSASDHESYCITLRGLGEILSGTAKLLEDLSKESALLQDSQAELLDYTATEIPSHLLKDLQYLDGFQQTLADLATVFATLAKDDTIRDIVPEVELFAIAKLGRTLQAIMESSAR